MNTILCDLDGVLTDNKIFITCKGEKFKSFHSRDNRAIAELIAAGYEFHVITASKWPGSEKYCKNLKVFLHIDREKDVSKIVSGKDYIAIGDDLWDKDMLEGATLSFCPADADEEIKKLPGIHILETKGGGGIICELVWILLHGVNSNG